VVVKQDKIHEAQEKTEQARKAALATNMKEQAEI
jgi:hypothetical protein